MAPGPIQRQQRPTYDAFTVVDGRIFSQTRTLGVMMQTPIITVKQKKTKLQQVSTQLVEIISLAIMSASINAQRPQLEL